MNHDYRYLTSVLLVALASACSDEDDTSTARNPNVAASGGSAGTASSNGSAGASSTAPSSAAAGSSGADRASGGTQLGDNAGPAGSQGSRGGGRFRDRDPEDLDAGVQDAGDVAIDGGEGDAGAADGGVDASFAFPEQ